MTLLTMQFLGTPQVTRADGTALVFRSRKALALLVYLAIEGRQVHSRDSLLGLLWPEDPEEAARNSLRVVLANLRQTFGEAADQLLRTNRSSLQFATDSDHVLDIATISDLLADCRSHPHDVIEHCPQCTARLTEAAALYRGEFLAGFALPDSAPFQEWAVVVREQLHQQAIEVFDTLSSSADWQGNYAALCRYTRRQLVLEPWREQAHRKLMRGLLLSGDRTAAMAQYATCCRVMESELGIEPDQATHALYEQIRTGTGTEQQAPDSGGSERALAQLHSGVPESGHVYGREQEVAHLRRWLLEERCQIVALLGIGGVGKTTLAATVVRAIAPHFEIVIWRSLLNAPRLDELLRLVLQSLAEHTLAQLPASPDDQCALLLDYLRKRRCLLVLDNLESLLADSGIGQMRAGYEEYASLLYQLAHSRHLSCLLLTSRERPRGMARWEAELRWVRTMRLEGLDMQTGQTILSVRGLQGQEAEVLALVARYSGHPLALILVAETVRELFGGAIGDFLKEETFIFDDIRAVLNEQFSRLSALEQEILFWLAIEREPTSATMLRTNLVHAPASGHFLEALRALKRRSLLEQHGTDFMLQNVVIEYLVARLIDGVCAELTDDQALAADHPLALSLLKRFALLKAQAKEYVRQSQVRVNLQPIVDRLVMELGETSLTARIRSILAGLRTTMPRAPGYAGGNLLNLLLHHKTDLSGYDFSRLSVWQADLRGKILAGVNFAEADLSGCAFTFDFSIYALRHDLSGHMLVAAPFRGGICVWRVVNGQLHASFRRPGVEAYPLAFSPDGRLLAGCCLDGSLHLWSVETGVELLVLHGHAAPANAVAFSDDAHSIASTSFDNTIRVWDVRSGECVHVIRAQHPGYSPLAFRPVVEGENSVSVTLLAGAASDQTICLWDSRSGAIVDVLHGHTQTVQSLAFSPDGRLLASGAYDGTILLWEISNAGHARLRTTVHSHSHIIRALAFHPDSHLLASASADHTIRLWDVPGNQTRQILSGHTSEVVLLSFHPDGRTLASSSVDRVLKLWDVQTGRTLDSHIGYLDVIYAVRFRHDGRQLASASADGLVRLWNRFPGSIERSFRAHTGQALAIVYSPDGRLLASGGTDGIIQVWNADAGIRMYTLHGHTGAVKSLAFSPDGHLLASSSADRTIRLWPVMHNPIQVAEEHGRVLYGHTDEVATVAFGPDGRMLISSSHDRTARLWSVDTGQAIYVLSGHTGALCAAVFSPTGDHVASIGYDNMVHLWEVATGRSTAAWSGPSATGRVVAFSPRGDLLVHSSEETALVIRDLHSGQINRTLYGHTSTIVGLDFSPTEAILASSSWDGTIRVWEVETGICLRSLRVPGPYAGMHIAGVTGITDAQRAALISLGAEDDTAIWIERLASAGTGSLFTLSSDLDRVNSDLPHT